MEEDTKLTIERLRTNPKQIAKMGKEIYDHMQNLCRRHGITHWKWLSNMEKLLKENNTQVQQRPFYIVLYNYVMGQCGSELGKALCEGGEGYKWEEKERRPVLCAEYVFSYHYSRGFK